jgi:aldehyde dehydrogenase (NAD+)
VTSADLDTAVRAARRAQSRVWGRMPGAERGKYLFRIARGIAERARELAVVETLDNGKPIKETRDFDVPTAAQHFFYNAGWADKLGHLGLGPTPQPLGVAGQVIPWNFPLLMAAWKIAPALAAGNTVVIKPAETTSVSMLVLAQIIADADLPPGVVNIVTGAGDIGSALVNHPGIDKVAFTGSTAVGRRIQAELAGTGRKITLELGGKGANIVFADAALDQAVEGIVNGIFFNSGQVCCAGSRLLVAEPVADELLDKLKARVETLRVGDPMDKNTDVGAINSAAQLKRITTLVDAGVAEGADAWVSSCPLPANGYFVSPTIFTNASASMRVSQEEIFGPVLTSMTFRTPDEALAKANNSAYGLSAGVWTEKGSQAMGMAAGLRAGVIWDNTFNRFDPAAAFGGYQESGFGREGGPSGLAAYLDADDEPVVTGRGA